MASVEASCPFDIDLRVKAVNKFSSLPISESLASANKRVANILSKLEDDFSFDAVEESLLAAEDEILLSSSLKTTREACTKFVSQGDYYAALEQLSKLNTPLNSFFDNVMVNCGDNALRFNRLNLLKSVYEQLMQVANISELAGK